MTCKSNCGGWLNNWFSGAEKSNIKLGTISHTELLTGNQQFALSWVSNEYAVDPNTHKDMYKAKEMNQTAGLY